MTQRVTVVPWGNIEDPDAPLQYGLKIGKSYVCRGREVVLFCSLDQARSKARALERQFAATQPTHAARP